MSQSLTDRMEYILRASVRAHYQPGTPDEIIEDDVQAKLDVIAEGILKRWFPTPCTHERDNSPAHNANE